MSNVKIAVRFRRKARGDPAFVLAVCNVFTHDLPDEIFRFGFAHINQGRGLCGLRNCTHSGDNYTGTVTLWLHAGIAAVFAQTLYFEGLANRGESEVGSLAIHNFADLTVIEFGH